MNVDGNIIREGATLIGGEIVEMICFDKSPLAGMSSHELGRKLLGMVDKPAMIINFQKNSITPLLMVVDGGEEIYLCN